VGNDAIGNNVVFNAGRVPVGIATGCPDVIVPAILAFLLNSAIKIFASSPSVGGGE
jgi:hypothetical protein